MQPRITARTCACQYCNQNSQLFAALNLIEIDILDLVPACHNLKKQKQSAD